ncbi:E3 SUMO-protein ligase NSE2-like [Toxorhynchites rutilus septentrionalis]|uniref:E3 SUMO-protein ligase NSE2-like n=1 Tax=Toxorhynchites rutilus septentrionalis TaxID=329112 RepID=UPI0024786022|nr:E3 SUMO-protein ligase NSE2-like [Toxorhynchites rutilus septentrionalis]
MTDMFAANLEKIFESILSTIRVVSEFGAIEQHNFKIYGNLAEKLIATEIQFNAHRKALQESSGEVTPEEFERRYEANAAPSKTNIKNLKRYKDFMAQTKMLLTLAEDQRNGTEMVDDDLHVEETICDIDPITKRPLEIPVRNKICNHVYEKSSIEALLKNNPRTRCPVMGCAANQFVTLTDLAEDRMLQHKLKLQRRENLN